MINPHIKTLFLQEKKIADLADFRGDGPHIIGEYQEKIEKIRFLKKKEKKIYFHSIGIFLISFHEQYMSTKLNLYL